MPPPTSIAQRPTPCRLLGLPEDPQTRFGFPHPVNSCYAVDPATGVLPEHQRVHCLSSAHRACPLFRYYQARGDSGRRIDPAKLSRILILDRRPRLRARTLAGLVVLVLAGVFSWLSIREPAFAASILGIDLGGMMAGPSVQVATPTAAIPAMVVAPAESKAPFLPQTGDAAGHQAPIQPSPTVASPSATPQPAEPEPSGDAEGAIAPTVEPSATAVFCSPPAGWVLYIVRPGDSLYGLSRSVGSSVDALREANCLVVGSLIYSGQRLYLPDLPPATATPSGTPAPSSTPTLTPAPTITATIATPTNTPTQALPTQAPTEAPASATPEPRASPTPTPTLVTATPAPSITPVLPGTNP